MNGNLELEKDNTVNGNRVSVVRSSLHTSQVAPSGRRLSPVSIFLLPLGWDAFVLVHCRNTPSGKFAGAHSFPGWRDTLSPTRAQTQTTRSGEERTNREA